MKTDKVLNAITDTILEKERQKLFESVKHNMKDEWDEIEWELSHPSKELCEVAKATREAYSNIDKNNVKIVTINI